MENMNEMVTTEVTEQVIDTAATKNHGWIKTAGKTAIIAGLAIGGWEIGRKVVKAAKKKIAEKKAEKHTDEEIDPRDVELDDVPYIDD